MKKDLKLFVLPLFVLVFIFVFSACSLKKTDIQNQVNEQDELSAGLIEYDLMSDEEKEAMGIDLKQIVQILSRDENGLASNYTFIASEEYLIKTEAEINSFLAPVEISE